MEQQCLYQKKSLKPQQVLFGIFLFSTFLITPLVQAQYSSGGGSGGYGWSSRAEARASSRWTLQEWLAQKQRNNLMDQWLLMHSPSPYEFFLSGAYWSYDSQIDQQPKVSHTSLVGSAAAYAEAVGITGEYQNNVAENYNDVAGMLSLRILGNSLQTTSLTLHAGQRTRQYIDNNQKETVRNYLGDISLQAYMTHHFGIIGTYRQYLPSHDSVLGDISGTLVEGGLFIDFKGLRIFGKWHDDLQVNKSPAGVKTEYKRRGIQSGLTIFF